MEQVEMSNTYIDMGVNNGSEKWTGKTLRLAEMYFKWKRSVICCPQKILNFWDKYTGNGLNDPDYHTIRSLSV